MSWLSKVTGIHIHKWKTTTDPGTIGGNLASLGKGVMHIARNPFESEGWRELGQGAPMVAGAAIVSAYALNTYQGYYGAAAKSGANLTEAQMIADLGGSPGFGSEVVGGELAIPAGELTEAQMIADLGGSPGFGSEVVGIPEIAAPTGELTEAQMIADLGGSPGFGADIVPATNKYLDAALSYAGKAAKAIGTSYAMKMILPSSPPSSQGGNYTSYLSGSQGGGGPSGGGGGSFTDMLANDDGSLNWKAYAIVAAIVAAVVIERKSLGRL
jgi:hypothetical protein